MCKLRPHSIYPNWFTFQSWNHFRFVLQMLWMVGFGAVALATSITTYPFPLNMSAKIFTLCNPVQNNFYTRNDRSHNILTKLYNTLLTEKSKCIHYWTPPSRLHAINPLETCSQDFNSRRFKFSKCNNETEKSWTGFGLGFDKWNSK